MQKNIFFTAILLCLVSVTTVFSQKYKVPADTIRLNREYIEVSNDISTLLSKIAIAQNNLPGYHAKANNAAADAQGAAQASSEQASKATNGSMADARRAKRKAGNALKEAKDARSANSDVESQERKIADLNSKLTKKRERLTALENMRAAILRMQ